MCEGLDFNLLFCWFLGMQLMERSGVEASPTMRPRREMGRQTYGASLGWGEKIHSPHGQHTKNRVVGSDPSRLREESAWLPMRPAEVDTSRNALREERGGTGNNLAQVTSEALSMFQGLFSTRSGPGTELVDQHVLALRTPPLSLNRALPSARNCWKRLHSIN